MSKLVPADMLKEWQDLADRVADAAKISAALVMRVWPKQIEVLVASQGENNPYGTHEKADLGTGLYCETVMNTGRPLRVPNALNDPAWATNPDVKLNMISYLGIPLIWPDDTIFGTVCVLDRQPRRFDNATLHLLQALKAVIEEDFRWLASGQTITPERHGPQWQTFENCIAAFDRNIPTARRRTR